LKGSGPEMRYQQIMKPVFPVNAVGLELTNDGEIDTLYLPAFCQVNKEPLKIVRRRFPDGRVSWFEEVKF